VDGGTLYVLDDGTLRAVDLQSQAVRTIHANVGSGPMAADGHGNVYVVDNRTDVLNVLVAATGEPAPILGVPYVAATKLGPADSATLNYVYGLAMLPSGNLLATTENASVVIHNRE
jgi:hypothetical protein